MHYHECSEGFTVADVEKLIGLACELELDHCGGFDEDYLYQFATVHAINALLLLVASDRSIADTVAQRFVRRCAETIPDRGSFVAEVMEHNMVMLLCECGPPAVPYLVTEMRRLLLTPNLKEEFWLGSIYVSRAMLVIIRECYTDIPLAILLTDQFCAPLLEFGRHPTATRNPVNKENASYLLSALVEVAILIMDENAVLELCRSEKCLGDGYDHRLIDVLRLFSLEPHPQDELLHERGNRRDWVIQTWNENHPDKHFPFPRGVMDGPFPGQPGYELPKRLFRHKYCSGNFKCNNNPTIPVTNIQVCERCKHTYYCSEECQRYDWDETDHRGRAVRNNLESYPPKFRIRPLKRLTEFHQSRSGFSSHRPQCLLIQAFKQWVKIDKRERNAVAAANDG